MFYSRSGVKCCKYQRNQAKKHDNPTIVPVRDVKVQLTLAAKCGSCRFAQSQAPLSSLAEFAVTDSRPHAAQDRFPQVFNFPAGLRCG